ncbi:MAG TPA: hypothetical protein VE398_24010 [Acidobacteriota bacterium]|nr:hypothetical protein [Acidobacteriota bacterium]
MRLRHSICGLALLLIASALALAQDGDTAKRTKESVARDLDELARIASVMVDGDLCRTIMSKRSLDRMFVVDPKDPWAASDDFNVNYEPYIRVKKTLTRLSRLLPYPCDVNLWMPFEGRPDKIQILIRNVNELSQFWTWGDLTQDMVPEMKQVLETGARTTVMRKAGLVSVLAPVRNSLGDIVALLETVSLDPNFTPPQVHARLGAGGQGSGAGEMGKGLQAGNSHSVR